ncbi:hypothetical protein [Stenotrophomonas maltophilia]|uniref:hypothetical protein n=1 Tax=Stenotrophomonas maltophilia TaxID=40324 RepID=UPI0013D99FEB|nr:hypothetical protein [Stenotrophomonas maltophilia]
MAKFIKPFRGVPEGEIYPVEYAAGDDCPPELEAGALSFGALSLAADAPPPSPLPDAATGASDLSSSSVPPAPEVVASTSSDGGSSPPAADKEALIQQLEAAGIAFDKRWGAEKLAAALAEGRKE